MFNFFDKFINKKEISKKIKASNVANKEELHKVTSEVLDEVYNIIGNSYGSYGCNSIISNIGGSPSISKDGLRILSSIKFEDKMASDIFQLITQISSNLVNKVGDGSTSAIISARNIFNNIVNLNENSNDSKELTKTLQSIQEILEEIIKIYFKKDISKLDREERVNILSKIATVSNNNDIEIGEKIARIMADLTATSIVKIKDNPQDNTDSIMYNFTSGYPLEGFSVAHPIYFTNKFKNGYEINNPIVIMTYEFLPKHYDFVLKEIIQKMNDSVRVPVVIIAETIEKTVFEQLFKDAMVSINSGKIPQFIPVNATNLSGKDGSSKFLDLSIYLNADPIAFNELDTSNIENLVGSCHKLSISTSSFMTFEKGYGYRANTKNYQDLLTELQKELDETPNNNKIERGFIRGRINRLNGVNATIMVGGRTAEEKENLRFLVEDSVLACQSVIKNGYTIGGNITPLFALFVLISILSCKKEGIEDIMSNTEVFNKEYEKLFIDVKEKLLNKDIDFIANIVYKLIDAYIETAVFTITKNNINTYNAGKYRYILSILQMAFIFENNIHMESGMIPNIFIDDADFFEIESFQLMPIIYNSVKDSIEGFYDSEIINNGNFKRHYLPAETTVLAPVNTDIEIIRATFSIVSLILSSNQYLK